MNHAISFLLGFLVGIMLIDGIVVATGGHPESFWHDEISTRGYGEYYLDKHHERQWRWK